MEKVKFTAMKDDTAAEFQLLSALDDEYSKTLPSRIIDLLKILAQDDGGYRISRLAICYRQHHAPFVRVPPTNGSATSDHR